MPSFIPVDSQGGNTSHSQLRRFDVKTFTFLDPHTDQPSVEEMFFCCWVEICTEDVDCAQSCSIVTSEGDRSRREVTSESRRVQLLSLGPLLLGQNSTELEGCPCDGDPLFEVTVCILSAVSVALLVIMLLTVVFTIKKCRPTAERACDTPRDSTQAQ
ncbi:hypothetical protein LDENG_00034560 [Lucifuga dentata]|nr:hypothetical protein LDENG_00034560 [Lucifuga dentata]